MENVKLVDASVEGTATFEFVIDERYSNINGVMRKSGTFTTSLHLKTRGPETCTGTAAETSLPRFVSGRVPSRPFSSLHPFLYEVDRY